MVAKAFCRQMRIIPIKTFLQVSDWHLMAKNIFRKMIHSLVLYYFFYNFGNYRQKEDWRLADWVISSICLSTFLMQRCELCYFTVFQKVREIDEYIANLGQRHGYIPTQKIYQVSYLFQQLCLCHKILKDVRCIWFELL